MKSLPALIVTLVGLFCFAGCADQHSDPIAMRVAAFKYAFEQDSETKHDPTKWIFTIESDYGQDEVEHALSRYPLAHEKLNIEDRGSITRIDTKSGKRFAYWHVEIRIKTADEAWADVGCTKGGLNGYGQWLVLRKKFGRWIVVSSTHTWLS